MRKLRIAISLLIVFAAFGLTACGSSSKDKLSKSELAKKANGFCKKGGDKIDKLETPKNLTDVKVVASYVDKLVPEVESVTKDIEGLKPADNAKADWNTFVSEQRTTTDELQAIRKRLDNKDASAINDLKNLDSKKVDAAASKVGATVCAGS